MKDCMDFINSEYDPIFISTAISEDSKNILDLKGLIENHINIYQENDRKKSLEILSDLLNYDSFTIDKINELKLKFCKDENFKFDKFKENEEFIRNLYLNGKLMNEMKNLNINEKPKTIVIVFGNESRGVSEYIKRNSHHKIMIPHFGHTDTSYNLSVSCGMILFYLYSVNILPGCFTDFTTEKGSEILSKNVLHNFQKIKRVDIIKLGLEEYLDDF